MTEPETAPFDRRRSVQLALVLWPFATLAVAINLFLLGLLGSWLGLAVLTPREALALSLPLGLPATYAAMRWVRSLIELAERN